MRFCENIIVNIRLQNQSLKNYKLKYWISIFSFGLLSSMSAFAIQLMQDKTPTRELRIDQIIQLPDHPKDEVKSLDDQILKDYLKKILGIQDLKDFKSYLKKLNKTHLSAKDIEKYQNLNAIKMLDSVNVEAETDTSPEYLKSESKKKSEMIKVQDLSKEE